jgi:phenylalanyl-tRNA synthetase beta chain
VSTKEDIVEEVVRFYGFNKVPSVLPSLPINPPVKNNLRILERLVSSTLVKELSYVEVYNYSFVSAQQIGNLGDDLNKYIELDNPLSKEKPFLRRNLLPNLLDNVRVNIENFQEVKIFEIGKVFSIEQSGARAEESGDNLLPRQDTWVCAMYASKKENNPFWQARKSLEVLFAAMGQNFKIVKADKAQPWEHPARMGLVELFGVVVGSIMEIRPTVTEKLGIEQRIGVLRLNLSVMSELLEGKASGFNYMPALVYPEVARDLAFLVKSEITHEQILNKLMKADPLLKKVELFDVYAGENIGEGYKSMAYTLVFFDEERTLTAQEVDVVVKKVCDILQKEFDAEVRK